LRPFLSTCERSNSCQQRRGALQSFSRNCQSNLSAMKGVGWWWFLTLRLRSARRLTPSPFAPLAPHCVRCSAGEHPVGLHLERGAHFPPHLGRAGVGFALSAGVNGPLRDKGYKTREDQELYPDSRISYCQLLHWHHDRLWKANEVT
jgi:hypothetical protein